MHRCVLFLAVLLPLVRWAGPPAPPPLPKDTLPAALDPASCPPGLGERPETPNNPLTAAKVQLGRKLFFDPKLSKDGTVACASCHDPAHGFASKEPRAVGIRGQVGRRNAPSLLNRAFGTAQFWDGRAATLEEQALLPIEDPAELGHSLPAVLAYLKGDATYAKQFATAFPDGVTKENLAKALASFQRTLLHGDTPYDAFVAGDVGLLSGEAKHGLWLFESKGLCWKCHSGPNFTDELFHNTGVGWGQDPIDLGRFEVTKKFGDQGRFKTPTLRAVALSPPYMHDGSIATLEEVVKFYNRGGNRNPFLDPALKPLELTSEEEQSLVAFLRALSERR